MICAGCDKPIDGEPIFTRTINHDRPINLAFHLDCAEQFAAHLMATVQAEKSLPHTRRLMEHQP